jgi:molecular chaperone HscC
VRFTYDVNGLLQVEATLRKTQKTSRLVIEGNPGLLSEQEIGERLLALGVDRKSVV